VCQMPDVPDKVEAAGSGSNVLSDLESEALELIRTEGQRSIRGQETCVRLIKQYNLHAIHAVDSSSSNHDALEALQKAEVLTQSDCCPSDMKLPLSALTFNNLGCYFKKAGVRRPAVASIVLLWS
jgi:hypothetical protein